VLYREKSEALANCCSNFVLRIWQQNKPNSSWNKVVQEKLSILHHFYA
jgi:hypothetical protein